MRNNYWALALFLMLITVSVSGCQLIADIFQAGVWVGVLLVVGVIVLVVIVLRALR